MQELSLQPRRAAELLDQVEKNIHRVIVGKDRVVRLALAGLVIIAVLVTAGFAAPLIAPYDPNEQFFDGLTLEGSPLPLTSLAVRFASPETSRETGSGAPLNTMASRWPRIVRDPSRASSPASGEAGWPTVGMA